MGRQLETALAERLAKVLLSTVRGILKPGSLKKVASWQNAKAWEEMADSILAGCVGGKVEVILQQPLTATALLLYFCCAAHQSVSAGNRWTLGERMATSMLEAWSSKKGSDTWCEAGLSCFSSRCASALLAPAWGAQIKGTAKPFVQRRQLTFMCTALQRFQSLPEGKERTKAIAVSEEFAKACADLLDESQVEDAMSPGNKQKLRREALRAIKVAIKVRAKLGGGELAESDIGAHLSNAASKLREALPVQRGEVHQACTEVQRLASGSAPPQKEQSDGSRDPNGQQVKRSREKEQSDSGGAKATEKSQPGAKRSRRMS